ncbi:hypothetical protein Pcinc_000522 [Petrolisthes cinctipes]|uniref:N-acetylglucosaminylphosphatidylinositol deacetylase n=1 Tax=Petrolisthes cinctipes TaxID=88211 RepID=A0AAE1GML2_PETCI|nr:hypothetical protein Pcinc_000522 [Petrolisthes cinctipes]
MEVCDQLPDHPTVSWPTLTTASLINHYIHALDIDVVITFDRWGVSGHINHIAIHTALQHLMEQSLLPQGCEVYQLETVSVLRKYLSFLDVPLTYILSTCVFTLNTKQWSILQRAMRQHKSQMLWFRYIYIYLSRQLSGELLKEMRHGTSQSSSSPATPVTKPKRKKRLPVSPGMSITTRGLQRETESQDEDMEVDEPQPQPL